MFDETLLDRMNFGDLNQALDYVLERIGKIEDGRDNGLRPDGTGRACKQHQNRAAPRQRRRVPPTK